MPWLPVKKIRRQFKLLLLLVLLTSAVWVTYLHISLARQGKTLRLPFIYSRDGERLEGTDPAHKPARIQASPPHSQAGDSSEELPTLDTLGWRRSHRFHPSLEEANLTDTPLPWDEKRRHRSISDAAKLELRSRVSPDAPTGNARVAPALLQYKGKVNLHVFEDWCGGSVLHLKSNLHFPLYPHTRTTVTKLAVSPKWKNYGLRIFGYIHPYKDGDFQFAVASEDNSEFWLSTEDNPSSAQLIAYVGRVGSEWTAPGEFTKFSSQMSKPFRLMSSRRYYFELLHKQDDRGSDHVEVAWRLSLPSTKFEILDSPYLSLYTDETYYKMNEVSHIPRTLSSVINNRLTREEPTVDILRPDPRDTFYMTPMIEESRVENVLVPCAYNPTYVVKDFPIARYQGLQFVYLTFVYPNDFTRLTHMETENKCFYRESPVYLEKFGFYKYMKMDDEDSPQMPFLFFNRQHFMDEDEDESLLAGTSLKKKIREEETSDAMSPSTVGHGHTNISYNVSLDSMPIINGGTRSSLRTLLWAPRESPPSAHRGHRKPLMPLLGGQGMGDDPEPTVGKSTFRAREESDTNLRTKGKRSDSTPRVRGRNRHGKLEEPVHARSQVTEMQDNLEVKPSEESKLEVTTRDGNVKPKSKDKSGVANKKESDKVYVTRLLSGVRKTRGHVFPGVLLPKPKPRRTSRLHEHHHIPTPPKILHGEKRSRPWTPPNTSELGLFSWEGQTEVPGIPLPTSPSLPGGPPSLSLSSEAPAEELQDYSYEDAEPRQTWPEDAINWQRTFSVGNVDFEMLRSDWNDLRCNVSGNLQLSEAETVDMVAQYMEKLNEKNGGVYTLLRIINVEKRRDSARGNRYLLELELEERGRKKVRLAEYVYLLLHRGTGGDSDESPPAEPPEISPSPSIYTKPILCRPSSLSWNPRATVHFVVPVKNQARWVQQLITDLEFLYLKTHDDQFSLILVDYDSEDMDVEQALRRAKLPSYQYLKKSGNFERSAGLQAGVDTIQDNHSIVFLCDLHIHFPLSVLDSVRKHCVEGHLAFAPIVMRLGCGSSPLQPKGYWEVNGFGLFGIYKSDFDRIGGMNTEEFKDRWGGEDWELLDRVLQNGLEVERLRLRNFFHYYHSKRGMWNTQSQETPAKD